LNYLLDTCVVSELIKPKPEKAVLEWIGCQAEDRLYLSVLTLGELEKGIAKVRDERRKQKLRHWVDHDLQQRFAGRWLAVDGAVARQWGRLQGEAEASGRKMPVVDGLIAATAIQFGYTVVTRNTVDLVASGAAIVTPWPA
jgi:predicted nucleic acid-binding protein